MPFAFQTRADIERKQKQSAEANRQRKQRRQRARNTDQQKEQAAERPFQEFWQRLNQSEKESFFAEALQQADRTKRDGFHRLKELGGPVFEQYRQLILKDYFRLTQEAASKSHQPAGS